MPKDIAWLKQLLAAQGVEYRGPLLDHEQLPAYSLGGEVHDLPLAVDVARLDLSQVLAPTSNPLLVARRDALGIRVRNEARVRVEPFQPRTLRVLRPDFQITPKGQQLPPEGGAAGAVDWRWRWNRNWITTVRDQNPCGACWAFAGTALVEAMLKIESSYWARLSEGDVHDGMGSPCANGNNLSNVSAWLSAHGLADPGCWPWHTDNAAYQPTSDRSGRSVRMPAFTWVGDIAQQKQWIDSTGPLATWFDVYQDFDGYSGGYVYRRNTDPSNRERGGHFLLVVGYDDAQGAWICKNSWGAGWGDHGYVLVGYGEAGIDQYAKAGLTGINPDPWTKRRLSNGNLYESGNGVLHRNLEVVSASPAGGLTQYWRNDGGDWKWNASAHWGSDAATCPTFRGTTYNRNFEMVYLTREGRLHHWWRPGGGGSWNDGGLFGPGDYAGMPGFIQSDWAAPGDFEVVVRTRGGQLAHVWRMNGAPWTWQESVRFGRDIAYSGATLVQGDYYAHPDHGNLEVVAVRTDGQMQHFWRTETDLAWHEGVCFGSGVASSPVMIQGQYGMVNEAGPNGNFELVVAVGGRIQHWWRDNASGSMIWRRSATFGSDVAAVAGLCESSWGMNLEVIALRYDGQLQHYWRDGGGWHAGVVIGPA